MGHAPCRKPHTAAILRILGHRFPDQAITVQAGDWNLEGIESLMHALAQSPGWSGSRTDSAEISQSEPGPASAGGPWPLPLSGAGHQTDAPCFNRPPHPTGILNLNRWHRRHHKTLTSRSLLSNRHGPNSSTDSRPKERAGLDPEDPRYTSPNTRRRASADL